jgi:hypothetical protein
MIYIYIHICNDQTYIGGLHISLIIMCYIILHISVNFELDMTDIFSVKDMLIVVIENCSMYLICMH